jgi:hypothetical protein
MPFTLILRETRGVDLFSSDAKYDYRQVVASKNDISSTTRYFFMQLNCLFNMAQSAQKRSAFIWLIVAFCH